MKLNNLIKYNSLKIYSIFGYVAVSLLILLFLGYEQARIADKASGLCFEETPYVCETDIYIVLFILSQFGYLLIASIILLLAVIEFLYKKYKAKNVQEKTYSKPWTIIFWVGIVLELIPSSIFILLYVYYLYDEYIRSFFSQFNIVLF